MRPNCGSVRSASGSTVTRGVAHEQRPSASAHTETAACGSHVWAPTHYDPAWPRAPGRGDCRLCGPRGLVHPEYLTPRTSRTAGARDPTRARDSDAPGENPEDLSRDVWGSTCDPCRHAPGSHHPRWHTLASTGDSPRPHTARHDARECRPAAEDARHPTASGIRRSEERRVGKECRSRWSPYH